jgi:hypothetical protein
MHGLIEAALRMFPAPVLAEDEVRAIGRAQGLSFVSEIAECAGIVIEVTDSETPGSPLREQWRTTFLIPLASWRKEEDQDRVRWESPGKTTGPARCQLVYPGLPFVFYRWALPQLRTGCIPPTNLSAQ